MSKQLVFTTCRVSRELYYKDEKRRLSVDEVTSLKMAL